MDVRWQGAGALADLIRLSSDGNAASVRSARRIAGQELANTAYGTFAAASARAVTNASSE